VDRETLPPEPFFNTKGRNLLNKKAISFEPLTKALATLERAIQQPKNEFTRDSVIQRFEYSFELSWKLLQKVLEADKPLDDNSIKGILRESGKQKFIDSVEKWFEFQRARNLTSHTYNEDIAAEIFNIAITFPVECHNLMAAVQKKISETK
jgi:nucleotidyltransferase substrate binding protein (TIGR01987 family)